LDSGGEFYFEFRLIFLPFKLNLGSLLFYWLFISVQFEEEMVCCSATKRMRRAEAVQKNKKREEV